MHDWGYEAEAGPSASITGASRRCAARSWAGCSSINVMAYTRGSPGDYDRWARTGATGWSYADVLPYFRRAEHWEHGADQWRGGAGPLGTEFGRTTDPIFPAWIEAGRAAGHPVTSDYNGAESRRLRARAVHDPGRPALVHVARLPPSRPRAQKPRHPDARARHQGGDRKWPRPRASRSARAERPRPSAPRARSSSAPAPSTRRTCACRRASAPPITCGRQALRRSSICPGSGKICRITSASESRGGAGRPACSTPPCGSTA